MHEAHGRGRTRSTFERSRCPACAEALAPGARVCASCGERRESWRPRRALPPTSTRSAGLAAALAAIFPGAGHLYCERIVAGLMIMFVAPAALAVLMLVFVVGGPMLGAAAGGAAGSSAGATAGVAAGLGGSLLVMAVAMGFYAWQILDAYASARPGLPGPRRRRRVAR